MALSFTNLGASANPDINNSADATSYSNTSWTPPTSGLLVCFVENRCNTAATNEPTMSGNGVTWVSVGTFLRADLERVTLFGANASGSTAGQTTIDMAGQTQVNCTASFFHVDDADLSGGVAAAFVQVVSDGLVGGTATSGSLTLAAASAADNRPIACFYHNANEGTTPRASWTELDDLAGTGPIRGVATQYRSDAFETTASASWASATVWIGIAAEIKAATSGATDLTIQDATHAHSADSPTLTQVHSLTVADASHGHSTDAVALTQVAAYQVLGSPSVTKAI